MSTEQPIFERILVAVDHSDASRRAAELAVGLAAALSARVALLHVIDTGKGFSPELGFADDMVATQYRPSAQQLLEGVASALPVGVPIERLIREGDPPQEIDATAAKWGADLIVLGTHSHGRLARLLLGSTAQAVLRSAHCPVLAVGHEPKPVGHDSESADAAAATGPGGGGV